MSSIQARRATPIIPFVAPIYRALEPYAYTLIRVGAGAVFVPHGVQKLFLGAAATPMDYTLGALELVGGALLALGILTRPLALLLLLDVAAIILANYGKGWLWTRGGVQYHVFIFGMLLAVLIGGAGRHAAGILLKANDERLIPLAYAFARVYYAAPILPSGYEILSSSKRVDTFITIAAWHATVSPDAVTGPLPTPCGRDHAISPPRISNVKCRSRNSSSGLRSRAGCPLIKICTARLVAV